MGINFDPGRVDHSPVWARIVTHRFPVARWRDAVRAFVDKADSRAIKIVLEHESANS